MYSGSHKFGRGGGGARGGAGAGGGSKRKSFPPPAHRHSTPSSSSRLSLGGGGGGGANSIHRTPPPPPPQQTADESFRLIGGEPLSLAAIIRLVPDLVPEIKRVEAQGGVVRIKFDSNPKNSGNVIDVGGKEYHFTWVNEKDCDIYEERQGGEDGNGLLVETGYAWRKLTTQRVLDESAKKQVKMRSLESEQIHKSRTTKVLDPGNPSMKSQMKELAAAEASPWKHKQKKDFHFKKKNFEPAQVSPAKPAQRPVMSSITSAKGRHSNSPLPSPQNQYNSSASPSVRGSAVGTRTINDPTTTEARAKENSGSPNIILSSPVPAFTQEVAPTINSQGARPSDLQQLLITLLKDNPKGMSLMSLEKAVGDMTSGSARRIEPILKKIATFEPPGRYMLKPGVELGNKKSSPEDNNQKQFAPVNISGGVPLPDSGLVGKSPVDDVEQQEPLNNNYEGERNRVENFDPSQHLTDLFGDDEPPDRNEAQAASSSNSDSDTDSASSDSGTNSAGRSRSRSRTPAGSVSASGSDSEADSISNSKETSDVEIDIMSDDDKEPKNLQDKGHELSTKLTSWSMPEATADGNNVNQDGYESEEVDIENDFPGDNEAQLTTSHDQRQTYGVTDVVIEQEYDADKLRRECSDSVLNSSENKSKRGLNAVHMEQNIDNVKRHKGRIVAQLSASASGHMGSHTLGSSPQTPPVIPNTDHRDNYGSQPSNRSNGNNNANGNIGDERVYNYHVPVKPTVESLPSGRRPPLRPHTSNIDKPSKNPLTFSLNANDQEMNAHGQDDNLKQGDSDFIGRQDEDRSSNEKGSGKIKESPFGQKSSVRPDPVSKHHGAWSKKSHDRSTRRNPSLSTMDTGSAAVEKSPTKARKLQRELSDLEMGEFREPLTEEPENRKKQFDRVGSFKQSEDRLGTGSRNANLKVNNSNQATLDQVNVSSPNIKEVPRRPDSLPKRRSPEPYAEDSDSARLQWGVQSQLQPSMGVRAEVESVSNKVADLNKLANGEAFASQGADFEGYGETQRKINGNAPREDSQKVPQSHKGKGSKSRKSKATRDEEKRKDGSAKRVDKRKRNESSTDESASYSKYEKDEPELKGPIKSFSQYKEYVQEYQDKYDSYCSLNRILEKYRNEFQKLGVDLESAKGRDMEKYYGILAQLKESYRQCGTRHKRLKKIFIVLHEELKDIKQRIKDFAAEYMRD